MGGQNYGQGSSREHAALAPRSLGLRAVIVQSFARIHRANLVNFGILPLTFAEGKDYQAVEQGDELEIPAVKRALESGTEVKVRNKTKGTELELIYSYSDRQKEILYEGGLLAYTVK